MKRFCASVLWFAVYVLICACLAYFAIEYFDRTDARRHAWLAANRCELVTYAVGRRDPLFVCLTGGVYSWRDVPELEAAR